MITIRKTLLAMLAMSVHDVWAHWMDYMFTQGEFLVDGGWAMPKEKVDRWQRQARTHYNGLTEKEQKSDIEIALNKFGFVNEIDRENEKLQKENATLREELAGIHLEHQKRLDRMRKDHLELDAKVATRDEVIEAANIVYEMWMNTTMPHIPALQDPIDKLGKALVECARKVAKLKGEE